jgi:hypothetical protein
MEPTATVNTMLLMRHVEMPPNARKGRRPLGTS